MKLKSLMLVCVASLSFILTACNKSAEQITLQGKTMGTTYTVKYIDDGKIANLPTAEQVKKQLDDVLKVVNDEMSTYRLDSQISRFNKLREVNTPFEISPDFATVVAEAIRLNKITEGALDVTVGPLVNLWGFGPDRRLDKQPSAAQINQRAAFVGIDKLALNIEHKPTLTKSVPNLYLDLSSIAKGFGVDKIADQLEMLGLENYLVEVGGELRGKGKNLQGLNWQIAIEKPNFEQGQAVQITVPLHNLGMATSGNYRNYFEDEQGNRLSHIIDPKALKPVNHKLASITVLAPTSMTADGLSTGLFVLGAEKALEVAEREKLAIFLIIKNGDGFETQMSSQFKKLIDQK
ncbi:FAD:protein FMN transferase [[Haemophilus] ducreyi]|uniref:FAD:protein FMN transferase n=1 Tax=Haemophilus ducreyi TaxID=730 RepID=UPI00065593B1|nr:FAD:protein FMN transferase [[Haemophilus] ducreyi]AKO44973.1 thiamine biosynthesis protein ApbE [[Haemophilus] ducreyi]AKO46375.1 thiamine biosynthesis protein ApbE [[Haemophilus] ducreyi]AKO47721.1 thiamine biosynthesis protein ApbE [[Haemophilus] ducreyi]AKO49103.1 thiamine biosynthesis protein ApbE [[Haemophilus] ducreyi]OOS03054.1 thiamine biosynthesis protein ApbE [[Haemophilus] ducreyi]